MSLFRMLIPRTLLAVALLLPGLAWGQVVGPGGGGLNPPANTDSSTPKPAFRSGVVPSKHLAKFRGTLTPIVCFIGDSTVSQGNYVSFYDSLLQKIEQRLREDYPDKTITFVDRSIGGQSLSGFLTAVSSNWPSWYTNHALAWNTYVSTQGCTTLFINFGVNDTGYQSIANYQSVWANLLTWTNGPPDIVLITNAVANPAAGAPYNTAAYQAGYLSNPALMRTLAASGNNLGNAGIPPIGIIDVGRYFSMSVQGVDPVTQPMSYVVNPVGGTPITGTTFPFTPPVSPGGDFDITFSFTNGAGFTSGSAVLTLNVGGAINYNGFVTLIPNGGTNVYSQYYYAGGSANVGTNTNNWSTGTNTWEVIARGGRLLSIVNGVTATDTIQPRQTAVLSPSINLSSGVVTGGTTITVTNYSVGTPRSVVPTINATDCYGSTSGPNSGNGINHDSSICLNGVYDEVLQATTFTDGTLGGTTASIGGGALVAGACASGTVTVNGVTSYMSASADPQTYPGDGNSWSAYVSAANTVTVKVCATVAGTPAASVYNVRVTP